MADALSRIGLVVHPVRAIDEPLAALREWAGSNGADVVQVPAPCDQREVASRGAAGECDLIVSIGGDGTTLAAMRTGAEVDRPVMGVACGSLGVLTTVVAADVRDALDRFSRGEWTARELPALRVSREGASQLFAINDVVVVRAGEGQVFMTVRLDGETCVRFAGDGCIVSTATGSSGYALAAGGPLLMLEGSGFLVTPLTVHGGFCPPIVVGAGSEIEVETRVRHGGARLEVDGQIADREVRTLRVALRQRVARIVTFSGQEPFVAGLRRRGIIIDSPRILAEDRLA
jgi:NAD+ kinase